MRSNNLVKLLRSKNPDYQKIRGMVLLNQNLNGFDEQGMTPLMLAAAKQDFLLVQILTNPHYANQLDINQQDKNRETALVHAIRALNNNSNGIVKLILDKGGVADLKILQNEITKKRLDKTFNLEPGELLFPMLSGFKKLEVNLPKLSSSSSLSALHKNLLEKIKSVRNGLESGRLTYDIYLNLINIYEELLKNNNLLKIDFESLKVSLFLFMQAICNKLDVGFNQILPENFPLEIDKKYLTSVVTDVAAQQDEFKHVETVEIKADEKDSQALYFKGKKLTSKTHIGTLAQYAFDEYYKKPFKDQISTPNEILRKLHGATHVASAAHLIVPLIEFIKTKLPTLANDLLKDPRTGKPFSDEDIKLLQLAVIYHDSANTGEVSMDEKLHADNFRKEALRLGFPADKVEFMANALQNKDITTGEPNIYQMLIHDVDAFEIMRIFINPGSHQDVKDIYNEFNFDKLNLVKFIKNKLSQEEQLPLIAEIKNMVMHHAKLLQYIYQQPAVHKQCEHSENCYFEIGNLRSYHREEALYVLDNAEEKKAFDVSRHLVRNVRTHMELQEHSEEPKKDEKKVIAEDLKQPACLSAIHLRTVVGKDGSLPELVDRFIDQTAVGNKQIYTDRFKKVMLERLESERQYEAQNYITVYHAAPHSAALLNDVFTEFHRVLNQNNTKHRFRLAESAFQTNPTLLRFMSYFRQIGYGDIDNYSANYQEMALSVNPVLFGSPGDDKSASYYLFAADSAGGGKENKGVDLINKIMSEVGPLMGLSKEGVLKCIHDMKALEKFSEKTGGRLYSIHVEAKSVDEILYPSVELGKEAPFAAKINGTSSMMATLDSVRDMKLPLPQTNELQGRLFMHPDLLDKHVKVESESFHALSPSEEVDYRKGVQKVVEYMMASMLQQQQSDKVLLSSNKPLTTTYQKLSKQLGINPNSIGEQNNVIEEIIKAKDLNKLNDFLQARPSYAKFENLQQFLNPDKIIFSGKEFINLLNLPVFRRNSELRWNIVEKFQQEIPKIITSFEELYLLVSLMPEDRKDKTLDLFGSKLNSISKNLNLDELGKIFKAQQFGILENLKPFLRRGPICFDGYNFLGILDLLTFPGKDLRWAMVENGLTQLSKIITHFSELFWLNQMLPHEKSIQLHSLFENNLEAMCNISITQATGTQFIIKLPELKPQIVNSEADAKLISKFAQMLFSFEITQNFNSIKVDTIKEMHSLLMDKKSGLENYAKDLATGFINSFINNRDSIGIDPYLSSSQKYLYQSLCDLFHSEVSIDDVSQFVVEQQNMTQLNPVQNNESSEYKLNHP